MSSTSDSDHSENIINQEEIDKNDSKEEKTEFPLPLKKMMTNQEFENETKKTTHDELLKLGELNEKEKVKKENLKLNIEKKKSILKKYNFKPDEINDYVEKLSKNKDMLLINIQGIVKDLASIQEMDNDIINYYSNEINTHKKDLDSLKEETTELKEENEELEEKIELKDEEIENNWKKRVHKLRNKVSEYRQFTNCLYIILAISNIHTWIFSTFGYQAYFNFWYVSYEWLNFIIYHIIFFIPNMFQILTNTENYSYLYVLIVKSISNFVTDSLTYFNVGLNELFDFSIEKCMGIYLMINGGHQDNEPLQIEMIEVIEEEDISCSIEEKGNYYIYYLILFSKLIIIIIIIFFYVIAEGFLNINRRNAE